MCTFFSFCSDGKKKYYFNWQDRQTLKGFEFDSHASIAEHFKLKEDDLNKYEYNPLTKKLVKDNICCEESEINIRDWCAGLNWKLIVEPLIIKPIINPLLIDPKININEAIGLLKEYSSVLDSIHASVRASVHASVRESILNSVRASVLDSVRDSVLDSVHASVLTYFSSFFDIKYEYDFSSAIKLWESGYVSSFDNTLWRLHCGKDAKIVWEGKI